MRYSLEENRFNSYVLTPEEMQKIDLETIQKQGMSGFELMENAGKALFAKLIQKMSSKSSVAIIAGKGNNGGDGIVLTRLLFEANVRVKLFLLTGEECLKGDAKAHFLLLEKTNFINYDVINEHSELDFSPFNYLIDAIFGTGFSGKLDQAMQRVIKKINEAKAQRISVDIPSGLNGKTGFVESLAVKADYSYAIGALKFGLIQNDAFEYCGKVELLDIGFPNSVFETKSKLYQLNSIQKLAIHLPKRKVNAHKNDFAKLLIVGGSKQMSGSVALATMAALRSGCGLVKVATPNSAFPSVDLLCPEAMLIPLSENAEGFISNSIFEELENDLSWADVVLCGMGMGRGEEVRTFILKLLENRKTKLVLDADAINALNKADLQGYDFSNVVLTPHLGEFARLMEVEKEDLLMNSIEERQNFTEQCSATLLLKGKPSFIVEADKKRININGNNGMATAGSGDVLGGIIASFITQGLQAFHATEFGVFCHGLAGDIAKEEKTEFSLIASDLIANLPKAFQHLQKRNE